ncbi:ATP-binding protein [Streptomyces paromomycinus]|uniref:Transcriptional regulator n=1 Tax=Streptomyces paromomycinus TaxID=92743 RepID=A0A401VVY9_STREY|nr:LuxR family transcriptional regulator [Streptomyces paromomycinus]GCD41234.1 transcriptional regulator [Streptomyces paromomycinus]
MDEYRAAPGTVTGPAPVPAPEDLLVGRDAELARLFRTVDSRTADPAAEAGPVLLLTGDAGTGKSALLDSAARRAAARDTRVLRACGSESEADLAFSALHQLLRPVRAEADVLPTGQRAALHDAFGTGQAGASPGPLLTGLAVLGLLSALGERGPVLAVLDDAQWCDRASLDALAFAARRLAEEPVTVLVGARTGDRLPGFDRQVPVLTLGPLDDAAAHRLLDLQPWRPTGRTRARILDQAGGNPLALTELTRAAADPESGLAAGEPPSAGPLPLTDRLERLFAARLPGLPARTSRALLLLAAMDTADHAAVAAGLSHVEDDAWLPAEHAGLVRRSGRDTRFRHPLVRSAVYHAAPFDARRDAHRALAGMLPDAPDRRAWHLAAASVRPDAAVSAELERTADRARRRGGHAAAAKALQRAAELAPRRADGARLLVEAAGAAVYTGDLVWVEELAAAARARTDDPALLASAAAHAGRLATLTVRHSVVFSRLAGAAEELAAAQPAVALDLLAGAAVVRFYSGEELQRRRIEGILRRVPEHAPASHDWLRAWVRAVSAPDDGRPQLVRALTASMAGAEHQPGRLTALAVMAWVLDETPQAARAFDAAFDRWESHEPLPEGLGGAAAWTYVELGRWGQAREVCARMAAVGATAGLDHAVACAAAVDAVVLAHQGDAAAARARAADALALIDPLESRSVTVYARRALGAAAAAEGAYDTAYDQLRAAFTADGAPLHYHASCPALADLAAAAVRSGRREEASAVVERCARTLGGHASPRLRALLSRARALLAAPEDAEPHFRAALAEPVLAHWPFERAQALLDLAEWLRRRRRIAEARPLLAEALETFRRLGARPWVDRARTESRAAGLDVTAPAPDALAELSPQQQQIVGLAARGLTNREIGEKLFLSPRTVGSHLYRSFPKLGITARSQLRDLVEGALHGAG